MLLQINSYTICDENNIWMTIIIGILMSRNWLVVVLHRKASYSEKKDGGKRVPTVKVAKVLTIL